jgi:hypothetical protein
VRRDFSNLNLDPPFHPLAYVFTPGVLKSAKYWKSKRRDWQSYVFKVREGDGQLDDGSSSSQSESPPKKAKDQGLKRRKGRPPRTVRLPHSKKPKVNDVTEPTDKKSITELTGMSGGDLVEICHQYSHLVSPVKTGTVMILC